MTLQEALDCSNSHSTAADSAAASLIIPPEHPRLPDNIDTGNSELYRQDVVEGGTVKAAERLALSLIEDYEISRARDLKAKQYIGPLTMNLAKNAAEALAAYNKLTVGEKSSRVNFNISADKKTDVDAIKEMLLRKKSDENIVEGEFTSADTPDDGAK
jgi:hypothetical protein